MKLKVENINEAKNNKKRTNSNFAIFTGKLLQNAII